MFFSIADRVAFEKRKKEISKLPSPKNIYEIKQFGGVAHVGVNPEKVNFARYLGAYVPACQILYEKLQLATSDVAKVMRTLSDAFGREGEIFKELAMAHATIDVRF